MEIIVGESAGFCYGVKRAVDGTQKILNNNKSKKVCCLGELVHNKEVIEELKNKGLIFIENAEDAEEITIVRAHGISKETYVKIEKMGVNIIDYTCPNVLKIHQLAEKYSQDGYYIFLLGDKNHPENLGTKSYCGDNYFIIENEDDVEDAIHTYECSKIKKLSIISQTTFSLIAFNEIVDMIRKRLSDSAELAIECTICVATETRQKETEELAKKVECMIIVGGKNSSNTSKLYDIAKENCKKAIFIEDANELNLKEIEKYSKIGIMEGASTPQSLIQDIERKINFEKHLV